MKRLFLLTALALLSPFFVFAQWSNNVTENTAISTLTGEDALPKLAVTSDGSYYVSWFANDGSYKVRLQKLTFEGVALFEEGGILISDNPQNTWITDYSMTVDNEDNAIIVFNDMRNENPDVFAYKVSPEGEMLWGEDGINLSNDAENIEEYTPEICITSDNRAIVAWSYLSLPNNAIKIQSVEPDGTLTWGVNGLMYSSTTQSYTGPKLMKSSSENFILAFYKQTGPFYSPTRHIYAQQFNALGTANWANDVLVNNQGGISGWSNMYTKSDNAGGIIIAWQGDIDSDNLANTVVERVLADGTLQYGNNGVQVVSPGNYNHFMGTLAGIDEAENIYVFWTKADGNQNNFSSMAQSINANGTLNWGTNGVTITMLSPITQFFAGASVINNNVYFVYDENLGGGVNSTTYASALNSDGDYIWTNDRIVLCDNESEKIHPATCTPYNNQIVAAWEDDRNGSTDIYAQNFFTNGTVGNGTVLNNDATLIDLTVNGNTVENFSSNTLTYNVVLPIGTVAVPVIEGTPNDPNASVEVTDATGLPGTTTLTVTAEDGVTQLVYSVNMTVALNDDATLIDLTVNGNTVENFSSYTLTYNVVLPAGTVTVPQIEGTPNDPNASVEVTDATELPGTTTLTVTAEDGVTQLVYSVNMTVAVGIDNFDISNSTFFPNPADKAITITNSLNADIKIFNLSGVCVKELFSNANNSVIDITELNSGIYFIKIDKTDKEVVFLKLIVK